MSDSNNRIQAEVSKQADTALNALLLDPSAHVKVCSYAAEYLKNYLLNVIYERDLLTDMKLDEMRPRLRKVFENVSETPNSAFHTLFRMWTRVRGSMEDKEWLVETEIKHLTPEAVKVLEDLNKKESSPPDLPHKPEQDDHAGSK
jgi:hypothetical protein